MGIDQQVRDLPGLIVKDEVIYMTDIAVDRMNMVAGDITATS